MQQINPTTSTYNKTIEQKEENKKSKIKEKIEQIPDSSKKIILGLNILSVAAIAGIAIYKHKNPSTAQNMLQDSIDATSKAMQQTNQAPAKETSEIINNISDTTSQSRIKVTAADVRKKQIEKKVLKQEEKAKQSAQKITKNQNINRENNEISNLVNETIKDYKIAKNIRQGIKNSNDISQIQEKIDIANNMAKQAQENAKSLEKYKTQGTHKQRLYAQRAHNKAIAAQIEAKKTKAKGLFRQNIIKQEQKRKSQNAIDVTQNPNYLKNIEKQKQNAIKRQSKKEVERIEKKYLGKNSKQLIAMINSGRIKGQEEEVILNILNKRKKI